MFTFGERARVKVKLNETVYGGAVGWSVAKLSLSTYLSFSPGKCRVKMTTTAAAASWC